MTDPLAQYDPPAAIDDFPTSRDKRRRLRARWHSVVDREIRGAVSANFYDPLMTATGGARPALIEWTAFPKPTEDRPGALDFAHAEVRTRQFEYCEWCVTKDPASGKITRVDFTSETRAYWDALWSVDPRRVLALYRRLVSRRVQLADLDDGGGGYNASNIWTTGSEALPDRGGAAHMVVGINTLPDAVGVVSSAARRPRDVPDGGLYHADELIILTVSRLVGRENRRVSFSNPVGIYLQEPDFHRIELPAGAPRTASPRDCWRVVRGRRSRRQALHAVFSVPRRWGFDVGDLKIDGRRIEYGSQIARIVRSGTFATPLPRP